MANRDDLLNAVNAELVAAGIVNPLKKEASVAVDAVLSAIHKLALSEGSIRTPIGTFKRKETEARTGRNPKTGNEVEVPAKISLTFKVSQALVQTVETKKAAKKTKK